MKRSQKIILILVAAVLIGSAAVFGIVIFATTGEYEYSKTYYYEPGSPLAIETLNLESDIGAINIKYNTTPTDYYAKIDLDIRIKGPNVVGKSFLDFFKEILWENDSSPVTFDIDAKPTTWFSFGLSRRVVLDITLRTDVIYEIDALTGTGLIDMDVPQNLIINQAILSTSTGSVLINSALNTAFKEQVRISTSTGTVSFYAVNTNFTQGLQTTTSTGSLTLDFTDCTMGDDLVGSVSTGSINIKSYNMIYTQDCTWDIGTSTGSIDVEIEQYVEMDAIVTGSIEASTGRIDIVYRDDQVNVGALFIGSTSTGSESYDNIGSGGFTEAAHSLTSLDYNTASNKYTFTLSTSTGSIDVGGQSA